MNYAENIGDSVFYGPVAGGRDYMIDGAGPYRGGNINYFKQGMIFARAELPIDVLNSAAIGWHALGHGNPEYLIQRLQFATAGYYWMQGDEDTCENADCYARNNSARVRARQKLRRYPKLG